MAFFAPASNNGRKYFASNSVPSAAALAGKAAVIATAAAPTLGSSQTGGTAPAVTWPVAQVSNRRKVVLAGGTHVVTFSGANKTVKF